MKIINYNPKELEEWRILQQDGELVIEHQEQRFYDCLKKILLLSLCVIVAFATAVILANAFLDHAWKPIFKGMVLIATLCFGITIIALIIVHNLNPTTKTPYQPERTFREWFHARASKYKVISIDRLNKTGNTRLEVAFEKEDGSVLKCISPYVTVIESTKCTDHTLDVSSGVLYIAYGAIREPIEFVIPQKERKDG